VAGCVAFMSLHSRPACAEGMRGDEAFSTGDYATAYREWRDSADAGDASSMSAVGTLYDTGHGVPQDFAAALSWYRRAAEAGDVRAMFNVGAMYDNGRGTPVNRPEAIKWYRIAAERGNGRAAYDLATIYRDGDGAPRDIAAAIRFFRLAAAAGIEAAHPNLAALGAEIRPQVSSARPLPPARALARPSPPVISQTAEIAHFQQAALARSGVDATSAKVLSALLSSLAEQAARGNELAQYDVGFAFEHGIGAPPNPVKSYVYYLRAAASPEENVKAAALRGALEVGKQLTTEQHAEARDMLLGGAQ